MSRSLAVLAVAGLLAGCASSAAAGGGRNSSVATTPGPVATTRASPRTPGVPSLSRPCGVVPPGSARYRHVVWIWFENRALSQVAGQARLPELLRLGAECGLATNYHAVRHPSLPNYLAAATGRDPGPIGDCEPASCPQSGPTIFSQLGSGRWAAFDESMPAPCDRITSGSYAARHNPAVYFANIRGACLESDRNLSALPRLLAGHNLPAFTWITPNICDDMHDCSAASGDAWLATWLARLVDSAAYRADSTVIFITWDESSGRSATNRVGLFVVAPSVPAGARVGVLANHFALLRTTEWLLGLPGLGAAARAPLLAAPFGL